jgi:hypothetical protein
MNSGKSRSKLVQIRASSLPACEKKGTGSEPLDESAQPGHSARCLASFLIMLLTLYSFALAVESTVYRLC